MKFAYSLQFNAVPDWLDKYVSYNQLKKIIFQMEKDRVDLLNSDSEKCITTNEHSFREALDEQLLKVATFYDDMEAEFYQKLDILELMLEENPDPDGNLSRLDSVQPIQKERKLSFESRMSTRSITVEVMERLGDLRTRLVSLYVSLSELEAYVDLNRLAIEKILKKHDKVLEANLKESYLRDHVGDARLFTLPVVKHLHSQIERSEKLYADAFCNGNTNMAVRQMKTHLRDQVVYERNTVWKDLVGQERKTLGAVVMEHKPIKMTHIPFTKYSFPSEQVNSALAFLFSVVLFIVLLSVNTWGEKHENYCFALLIFAAVMWATEAIPLYATSLMIPFLIVPMGILRNSDGTEMAAKAAAKSVFQSMFSGTIMMLLGGFAIAAALSKYAIAKAFASHVLSRAGTRPRWVLLAIMAVATFLCMWISNVATPVLCFSLIDPILRTLPDGSPVAPCLLLGIALASCIGGMVSPISSPQNIVAIQFMNPNPGWGIWFGVALPIAILGIFSCWGFLLLVYRPDRAVPHLNTIKATKSKIEPVQVVICLVTFLTIGLWCAESTIEEHIGDTGIIATIPLFFFFGTGILNKEDLNAFLWSVVVLAQGGMALGNAVTSSGLLKDIALRIKDAIEELHPIAILAIFAILILVFSTFVSHTVAALIIVPIVQEVGQSLPVPHVNLLVLGAGLACSAGMGLPVSGYPNMSAIMMEDRTGKPYLKSKDFIYVGIPTSLVITALIFTLGYGIMTAIGY
ncbi:SPX domain-containing protein [Pilobolus umbonatus]|nr:SPX domain-containing protein [Pilobolus umbonatus]